MKKPIFVNNHIYHVYNRGVEKRKIFLDDRDHFRFVHDLFEFNDETPAEHLYYKSRSLQSSEVQLPKIGSVPHQRKLLVEILVFCLMSNHYHLLLRQKKEKGISMFMQKLGTGYTNYFNQKYERVGSLFQGRFKAVAVEEESHFIHLPYYIHLNPLELIEPKWKEGEVTNLKRATNFLESYRWSSYQDYIGKKNFPSVTSREFLGNILGSQNEYKKDTEEWLRDMDLEDIKDVILE